LNNAYQMDYQLKQQQNSGIRYYPQQQNNSTYWQEQNARNQYFQNAARPPASASPFR